jgi:cardiolipin synthase
MKSLIAAWGQLTALWEAVPPGVWLMVYGVWLVSAVLFILRQRRPATTTLAWLIAFMTLPVISAGAYLLLGPRRLRRRNSRRSMARTLAARFDRGAAAVLPDKLADRAWLVSLARVPCSSNDGPPRPAQRLTLFAGGDETYAAIELAILGAQRQVHMEYYIYEPDAVGTRLRDAMVTRARAGVKVRVLIDALGSAKATPAFWAPLVQAGGEVRLFNPVRFLRFKPGAVNFRTHRKIVVIDGCHAFTGGINVSAGNSAMSSGGSAWRDTHLELRGAPALDLQLIFLEDWLFAGEETLERRSAFERWVVGDGAAGAAAVQALQAEAGRWFPAVTDDAAGRAVAGENSDTTCDKPWVQIIDSGPDEKVFDIHRFFFTIRFSSPPPPPPLPTRWWPKVCLCSSTAGA